MLKKDLIELCLLHLLAQEDQYGYDLLKKLHTAFPDTQESAVYALLRGLGKSGLTSWYMAPGGGGPDRKYYKLTPAGQTRLEELRAGEYKVTWKAVTSSRLDTTALKKALPDVAARFMKSTTSRRFCVA